jgi:hypothetical protein
MSSPDDFTFSSPSQTSQSDIAPSKEEIKDPTIVFIFTMPNWTGVISGLSKLDLVDIAPTVATQFFVDFNPEVNGYVLILTKSKWDTLSPELKRKFMSISRRIKEEMEGPLMTSQRELYDNSDIFELLMGVSSPSQTPAPSEQEILQRSPSFVDSLQPIPEYAEI